MKNLILGMITGLLVTYNAYARVIVTCEGDSLDVTRSSVMAYVVKVRQNDQTGKMSGQVYHYASSGPGDERLVLDTSFALHYESFVDEYLIHHFLDINSTIDTVGPQSIQIAYQDVSVGHTVRAHLQVRGVSGVPIILKSAVCTVESKITKRTSLNI